MVKSVKDYKSKVETGEHTFTNIETKPDLDKKP